LILFILCYASMNHHLEHFGFEAGFGNHLDLSAHTNHSFEVHSDDKNTPSFQSMVLATYVVVNTENKKELPAKKNE